MKKLVTSFTVILMFILLLLSSISCATSLVEKIAFISSCEGERGSCIYSVNLDGSNQARLARWFPSRMPYHNVWSADGKTLACIDSDNETERYWLCLVDTDGQNRRRLLDMTDLKMDSMAFSPDGKTVILSLDVSRKIETPQDGTVHVQITYDSDLFTVDINSGELKRLTDTPDVWEKYPSFSPDGSKIGFVVRIDTADIKGVPQDIYVMDADGNNRTRLAHHREGIWGFFQGLHWSPAGTKMMYFLTNVFTVDHNDCCDIFVVDTENGNFINLTNSPTVSDMEPVWSPDSKKIAFCSGDNSNGYGIYIMDADGNNKTKLYDSAYYPFWSPDGKTIAFTDRQNIYTIDADGKNLKTLVEGEGTYRNILYPIWLSQR